MPLLTVISPILILRDHVKETMLFVDDVTSGLEKVNAQLKASELPLLTALNSHQRCQPLKAAWRPFAERTWSSRPFEIA